MMWTAIAIVVPLIGLILIIGNQAPWRQRGDDQRRFGMDATAWKPSAVWAWLKGIPSETWATGAFVGVIVGTGVGLYSDLRHGASEGLSAALALLIVVTPCFTGWLHMQNRKSSNTVAGPGNEL